MAAAKRPDLEVLGLGDDILQVSASPVTGCGVTERNAMAGTARMFGAAG